MSDNWQGKKVLVTGGSGFIGSHVAAVKLRPRPMGVWPSGKPAGLHSAAEYADRVGGRFQASVPTVGTIQAHRKKVGSRATVAGWNRHAG
jgi:hypothetical protein